MYSLTDILAVSLEIICNYSSTKPASISYVPEGQKGADYMNPYITITDEYSKTSTVYHYGSELESAYDDIEINKLESMKRDVNQELYANINEFWKDRIKDSILDDIEDALEEIYGDEGDNLFDMLKTMLDLTSKTTEMALLIQEIDTYNMDIYFIESIVKDENYYKALHAGGCVSVTYSGSTTSVWLPVITIDTKALDESLAIFYSGKDGGILNAEKIVEYLRGKIKDKTTKKKIEEEINDYVAWYSSPTSAR